jgi:16S rRNA processing protein RimM
MANQSAGKGASQARTSGPARNTVCVGQIVGVHGVRGLVKLKSFTEDPAAIAGYNPLMDQTGARTCVASTCMWIATGCRRPRMRKSSTTPI